MYVGLGAKLLTEIRADGGWILFLFKASILLAEALWDVSREQFGILWVNRFVAFRGSLLIEW